MRSSRQQRFRIFPSVGVMLLSGVLAACGGGGGDDVAPPAPPTAQGIAVAGNVVAPNGLLAKAVPQGFMQWFASLFVNESFAQAGGIAPVPNARVVVFHTNDDGTVVKPSLSGNLQGIIVEGQTDGQGNYGVTLPVGVQPASNLIVQLSNDAVGTEPRTVGSSNVLNAQAVREIVTVPNLQVVTVDLHPAAELATREIIARTAPAGGATLLGNYTTSEVAAFVGLLQSSSFLVSGATIQNMIDNIKTQFDPLIVSTLNLVEQPGQVTQPGGTYSLVRYFSEYDGNGRIRRYQHIGDVTLDPATGTFTFPFTEVGGQTQEACSTGCTRTFVTSSFTRTDVLKGAYLLQPADNSLTLTPGSGETLQAFASPDAEKNLVVLPFRGQFGILGIGLAVKKGSGLTATDIQGTFQFAQLGVLLDPSGIPTPQPNTWTGPLSSYVGAGNTVFTPPNLSGSGNSSAMFQDVTCTLTATGCTVAATLNAIPQSIPVTGTFTVGSDGALTILQVLPPDPPETLRGTLAGNKNLFLLPLPDIDGGSAVIGLRQATGLTLNSLTGTYRVVLFRDMLDTFARIRTFHYTATAVFNGAGAVSLTGPDGSVQDRTEGCSSAATCAFPFGVPGTPGMNVPNATYTVNAANGTASINIPGFGNFSGPVSPDGSFVVTTHAFDNSALSGGGQFSGRSMAMLIKQ